MKINEINFKKNDYWRYSDLSIFGEDFEWVLPRPEGAGRAMEKEDSKTYAQFQTRISSKENILNFYRLIFINGRLMNAEKQMNELASMGIELEVINHPKNQDFKITDFGVTEQKIELSDQRYRTIFSDLNELSNVSLYRFRVLENNVINRPIHCLMISEQDTTSLESNQIFYTAPRIHWELEKNSSLNLIEEFNSSDRLINNSVIEVKLAENAKMTHLSRQNEGREAFHISQTLVELATSAYYRSFVLQQGSQSASMVRRVNFNQCFAKAEFFGLYLVGEGQAIDNLIDVNHLVPDCESRQLYKGVLGEQAVAGFTGKVTVAKDAQRTLSNQLNNTLILGESSLMQSRPQLEILADDVKCNHGSTVGQVNEEEVFYLRSRGMTLEESKKILAKSFLVEFYQELEAALPGVKTTLGLK